MLIITRSIKVGSTVEARNAIVSKFSDVLFSLISDLWLSGPVSCYDSGSEEIPHKSSFHPCPFTWEILLVAVQHLAMIGLFEKIQPAPSQNVFLLSHKQKMYGIVKKPLYQFLNTTFHAYVYQFDTIMLSQVKLFGCNIF